MIRSQGRRNQLTAFADETSSTLGCNLLRFRERHQYRYRSSTVGARQKTVDALGANCLFVRFL